MYIIVAGFLSDIKMQDPGTPDHFHKMHSMVIQNGSRQLHKIRPKPYSAINTIKLHKYI